MRERDSCSPSYSLFPFSIPPAGCGPQFYAELARLKWRWPTLTVLMDSYRNVDAALASGENVQRGTHSERERENIEKKRKREREREREAKENICIGLKLDTSFIP